MLDASIQDQSFYQVPNVWLEERSEGSEIGSPDIQFDQVLNQPPEIGGYETDEETTEKFYVHDYFYKRPTFLTISEICDEIEQMTSIPHRQFEQRANQLGEKVSINPFQPENKKVIEKINGVTELRYAKMLEEPVLVLTDHGDVSQGKLPDYKWVSKKEFANVKPIETREIDYEMLTREHLDKLVQELYKSDVFPWENTNICGIRATFCIKFLLALGIPETAIYRQYASGPEILVTNARGKTVEWKYHVAPVVRLANGEMYVIDPSINHERALTPMEWLQAQHPSRNEETVEVEDLGLQKYEDVIQFDSNKAVLFTTEIERIFVEEEDENIEKEKRTFIMGSWPMERMEWSHAKHLHKGRMLLEAAWLVHSLHLDFLLKDEDLEAV